jgi:hypothetical protein
MDCFREGIYNGRFVGEIAITQRMDCWKEGIHNGWVVGGDDIHNGWIVGRKEYTTDELLEERDIQRTGDLERPHLCLPLPQRRVVLRQLEPLRDVHGRALRLPVLVGSEGRRCGRLHGEAYGHVAVPAQRAQADVPSKSDFSQK